MAQSTPGLQKDVTEEGGLHLGTHFPKRIQRVGEKLSPFLFLFLQIYHFSQISWRLFLQWNES